jgi:hypothetical protein
MHCTSREYGIKFPSFEAGKKVVVDISFENILKPGSGYSIYYSVNNTYSLENQEVCDAVEIGAVFDVVRDPENPIWYLVWHPFDFEYRLPEMSQENGLSNVAAG